MEGGSLNSELHKYFNYDLNQITRSGFIKQRNKLKPDTMEYLFHKFHEQILCNKKYQGYQLLACDGSDLNIFRDPLNPHTYFAGKEGTFGFNQLHLNALYDLQSRRYVDALIQEPYEENKSSAMIEMIKKLTANQKTIIMADRGYETYNIFANIQERGLFYLIRIKDTSKKGSISGSLSLPVSCEFDEEIELIITRKQKFYKTKGYKYLSNSSPFDFLDSENLFYTLHLRLTQFQLENGVYECIASNLDKKEFPPEKIKELYHMRWGIETSFRDIKYAAGLLFFHSRKKDLVIQEIYAKLILYNFCELITGAIVVKKKDRKYSYQINFSIAIAICTEFLRRSCASPPVDVIALIGRELIAVRPDRRNPRYLRARTATTFQYR